MRAVVDRGGLDCRAASASQMGRFETAWLSSEANLAPLTDLSGNWIDRVHARRPQATIVLDMDSSVSETHGTQEGSAYNGHFGCTCYHPLFVFNQFGGLERCALRPGNVHSADGWREVLEPVIARYRGRMTPPFPRRTMLSIGIIPRPVRGSVGTLRLNAWVRAERLVNLAPERAALLPATDLGRFDRCKKSRSALTCRQHA